MNNEELSDEIIELFEDLLKEKGLQVKNIERNTITISNIFGSDYDKLKKDIIKTLNKHKCKQPLKFIIRAEVVE